MKHRWGPTKVEKDAARDAVAGNRGLVGKLANARVSPRVPCDSRLSASGRARAPAHEARSRSTRPCCREIIRATIHKTTMTYKKDDYSATLVETKDRNHGE